jgi:hypothetical protein
MTTAQQLRAATSRSVFRTGFFLCATVWFFVGFVGFMAHVDHLTWAVGSDGFGWLGNGFALWFLDIDATFDAGLVRAYDGSSMGLELHSPAISLLLDWWSMLFSVLMFLPIFAGVASNWWRFDSTLAFWRKVIVGAPTLWLGFMDGEERAGMFKTLGAVLVIGTLIGLFVAALVGGGGGNACDKCGRDCTCD